MCRLWRFICLVVVTLLLAAAGVPAQANQLENPYPPPWEAVSTSGPQPVENQIMQHVQALPPTAVTLDVPAYIWRHGCGPTAVAMVLAYWDKIGYSQLLPGDASVQVNANQAIASQIDNAPSHFTDFARPNDEATQTILADCSSTPGCIPHSDDSIADFMKTSRSSINLRYGWSWFNEVDPAFEKYVDYINATNGTHYLADATSYTMWDGDINTLWNRYVAEIDAGRPVVLLVDTNGDGGTDHFVTGTGYDIASHTYLVRDTWYSGIRSEIFRAMLPGIPWGVYGITALSMSSLGETTHKFYFPVIASSKPFSQAQMIDSMTQPERKAEDEYGPSTQPLFEIR